MNNKKNSKWRGTALWLLLMLPGIAGMAQEGHRIFKFKPGEVYQKEILINSNAVVQRGKQNLKINTVSELTKSYSVQLSNERGTTFNVKIEKMENEIDAMGLKLMYNSAIKNDSTSKIIKALDFMVNKPVDVQINNYGIIQSYTDYKAEMATDTLVSFAGIQPEAFEKGTMMNILADFTYNPDLKKNFSWTDSVEIDKQRLVTRFWIEDVNEKVTIVKFNSKISTRLLNSNQNGSYVIDNATGLIMEKILYTISTGYQISAGGVIYAVARSTSVSEKTRRIK